MKPVLPEPELVLPVLRRIQDSGIYSNRGPVLRELEIAYANFLGVDPAQVVVLTNATLCLQACMESSSIEKWFIPNFTFAATGIAAVNAKRVVEFVDVDLDSFEIDLQRINNSGNFGVLPVAPFGAPINFDRYKDYENLIYDGAASLGSRLPDFGKMQQGWSVVFSLHATKVLGCGEGGLIVTDAERANHIRSWSNFGFSTERSSNIQGTNAKMPEITAAFGLTAIVNESSEKEEWRMALGLISKLMTGSRFDTYLNQLDGYRPYWIIKTKDLEETVKIEERMKLGGIETRRWWPNPLSEMNAFKEATYLGGGNSKVLTETLLGLPLYRGIEFDALKQIHHVLNAFL